METSSPTNSNNSCASSNVKTKRISPTAAINPTNESAMVVAGASVTVVTAPGSVVGAVGGSSGHTPATPELTSLFECPVCFDYVLPPILQCQNGHLVCQNCRQKITCCPTCRVPISSNIRNLPMEKLASTMWFPCKYSNSGCSLQLLYSDKPDHEDSCEFKPYQCPCPGNTVSIIIIIIIIY